MENMDQNNQYEPPNAWQTTAFASQFQTPINPENFAASQYAANPMQSFLGSFLPDDNNYIQNGDFQPDGNLNSNAFVQNGNINANPQFSPAHFSMPPTTKSTPPRLPTTDPVSRAAELKAKLLRGQKNRAASTPPNANIVAKQITRPDTTSSLREPQTPVTLAQKRDQELNVNDLIAQYSDPKSVANTHVRQEELPKQMILPKTQQNTINPTTAAKSQALTSLGSPTKLTKPVINGKKPTVKAVESGKRRFRNGSQSDASEGEIVEDAEPPKAVQAMKPKENQKDTMVARNDEARIKSRDAPITSPQNHGRGISPARHPPVINSKPQPPNSRDNRRDEYERPEKRIYQPEYNERKQYPEQDRTSIIRQGSRDDDRRPEINHPVRELKPPTLLDLLPLDDDLREWLVITGYHNAPYRDRILSRRRAIAALDAQRDKLLAEMQAEERGGIPAAVVGQLPASMLSPSAPNIPESIADTDRAHLFSNKRPYAEDQRENSLPGKIARYEDQMYVSRDQREDNMDLDRPLSRGAEIIWRPFNSRDDRDSSRGRYDGRGRSRERSMSPGRRAYEARPAVRLYDDGYPGREDFLDRDDRPYEGRGGYQGQSFNPNYRGAGRGRGRGGRGRGRSDSRERDFQRDSESYSQFGSKIANGKSMKDNKGFQRGGRGGP